MATQSDDFKWFVDNHDNLFKKYPNKSLVIKDKNVVCSGNSFEEALQMALKAGLEVGTFIIQNCSKGEECYIQNFSSRVVFA